MYMRYIPVLDDPSLAHVHHTLAVLHNKHNTPQITVPEVCGPLPQRKHLDCIAVCTIVLLAFDSQSLRGQSALRTELVFRCFGPSRCLYTSRKGVVFLVVLLRFYLRHTLYKAHTPGGARLATRWRRGCLLWEATSWNRPLQLASLTVSSGAASAAASFCLAPSPHPWLSQSIDCRSETCWSASSQCRPSTC